MFAKIKNFFAQTDNRLAILLMVIFALAVVATRPIAEITLNDDWLYADAVQQFHGLSFQLDHWIAPALMGQLFYAKILTAIFGWSFSLLRLSTLIVSALGIFFLYRLLINLNAGRRWACLLSLLWAFNPIGYNLSFSFMTDVPALSLVIIALYYYHRGFSSNRDHYFWLGSSLIIYASTIRQNYAAILPVFALVFIINQWKRSGLSQIILMSLAPMVAFGTIYLLFNQLGWWPTSAITAHQLPSALALSQHSIIELFSAWQYLGLFLLPLTLSWFIRSSRRDKILAGTVTMGASIVVALHTWLTSQTFPYSGNIINRYGLGTRDPNGVLDGIPPTVLTHGWIVLLTILAALGSGLLLAHSYRALKPIGSVKTDGFNWLLIGVGVSQLMIIMAIISFDRYYLILLLTALLLLAPRLKNIKAHWVSLLLLLLSMLIAMSGTYNYLQENRLKWSMANHLVSNGISPRSIDAGYEWLGSHWYYSVNPAIRPFSNPQRTWYTTKIFPDNTREYIISYTAEKSDYLVAEKQSYNKFLWGQGYLYLLRYAPQK